MLHPASLVFGSLLAVFLATAPVCHAEDQLTLMGTISDWQYPGSKINGASMSDAATVNAAGQRTIPSVQCKTVMTTADPVAKVVKWYKAKLEPNADRAEQDDKPASGSGRSVTFHEDSENRPVTVHMILVNADKSSTTLVISRAATESETHIAWTHYRRL